MPAMFIPGAVRAYLFGRCRQKKSLPAHHNEGVSIWVIEAAHIAASSPEEKGPLYEPANDKVYRHPTFFDIPDEVGAM